MEEKDNKKPELPGENNNHLNEENISHISLPDLFGLNENDFNDANTGETTQNTGNDVAPSADTESNPFPFENDDNGEDVLSSYPESGDVGPQEEEPQTFDYNEPVQEENEDENDVEDNIPLDSEPPLENSNENMTGTDNKADEVPEAHKFTAGEKIDQGKIKRPKPFSLNRTFILSVACGVLVIFVIFVNFIVPLFETKEKTATAGKPKARTAQEHDYYSLVPHDKEDKSNTGNTVNVGEKSYDEILDETLRDPKYNYNGEENPKQSAGTSGGGGGGGYQRPDTREDSLWGKNIPGIRGITPSQSQYLSGGGKGSPSPANRPAQQAASSGYQYPASAYPDDPNNPYAKFGMPSREEYMKQMIGQAGSQGTYSGQDTYKTQNDQSGKMNFFREGRGEGGGGEWLPVNTVWQGSIFEAILTSNINTDLPGECTAMVTKNVYNSLDGKFLLIPQNSRIFGSYNSSISYSQSRVQVGWHTLIRPDGYMINLGNFQATDAQGAAGLKGFVNDHPFAYLKALGLLTAFNIINSELGAQLEASDNQYVQNVMANSQMIANTFGSKLIDRAMDVQPTITIKSGSQINVVANMNLVLPVLDPYPVKHQYKRTW